MGISCERALKDTVAIGDGWMPLGLTPAQLATELGNLRAMCTQAKRDFSKIEITFLMLETLFYPDEVRTQELPSTPEVIDWSEPMWPDTW